jgi:glycerophosphoryl diester phosphodiesterase
MKKPLVLAHRGFSGKFPENTKRAFMEAIAITGCDGFESDVHLSADNEPVITHAPTLERTSNGKGPVRAQTFKELQKLDVGSWMDSRFAGETMMHLDELLDLTLKHNLLLNLELKNFELNYPGMEKIIIDRINAMNAADSVFLSSFNHVSMEVCKHIDPGIRTGLLYGQPLFEAEKYASAFRQDALHPRYHLFDFEPDLVRRAHEKGLAVHTWTVNGEGDMRRCIKLGVDSIITNFPDKLAEILRSDALEEE